MKRKKSSTNSRSAKAGKSPTKGKLRRARIGANVLLARRAKGKITSKPKRKRAPKRKRETPKRKGSTVSRSRKKLQSRGRLPTGKKGKRRSGKSSRKSGPKLSRTDGQRTNRAKESISINRYPKPGEMSPIFRRYTRPVGKTRGRTFAIVRVTIADSRGRRKLVPAYPLELGILNRNSLTQIDKEYLQEMMDLDRGDHNQIHDVVGFVQMKPRSQRAGVKFPTKGKKK